MKCEYGYIISPDKYREDLPCHVCDNPDCEESRNYSSCYDCNKETCNDCEWF